MWDADTLLFLLLISSIVSVVLIIFGGFSKSRDQLFVFVIVCSAVVLGHILSKQMYHFNKDAKNGVPQPHSMNVNPKPIVEKVDNHEFTSDKIIPVKSYNPNDCTNDGTCIQPPSEANIHGFHVKPAKNPFEEKDEVHKNKSKCTRCARPLTVENNPPMEDFKEDCNYNYCNSDYKKKQKMNEMCIYCKNAYLQNSQCFQVNHMLKATQLS